MSRKSIRYGAISILILLGLLSLGCVAVLTTGTSHKIQVSDNDGTTSLAPKKGLLR